MNNLAEERRYTYKDYLRWNSDKIRYEIIDGVAYAMAAPSQTHQRISRKLLVQFDNFLRGKTCEIFYSPLAVRLNADDFDDVVVEPDLFVICDKSKFNDRSIKGAPELIIEILSPYNTRHDTITKFRQYQKAGVKEYWIVDPSVKTIQVYILKNGKYGVGSVYRDDDIISVHTLKGCQIILTDVFYDTIEIEEDSELISKQKLIEVLKANGMSDEQIEKSIKMLEN